MSSTYESTSRFKIRVGCPDREIADLDRFSEQMQLLKNYLFFLKGTFMETWKTYVRT